MDFNYLLIFEETNRLALRTEETKMCIAFPAVRFFGGGDIFVERKKSDGGKKECLYYGSGVIQLGNFDGKKWVIEKYMFQKCPNA